MNNIKTNILIIILLMLLNIVVFYAISKITSSDFNYLFCVLGTASLVVGGIIRVYVLMKIQRNFGVEGKELKITKNQNWYSLGKLLITGLFIIIGLFLFLIWGNINVFTLKKITFLIIYSSSVYILLYAKGISIGNIDMTYSRAINVIAGIALLILSICCLAGPNY